MSKRLKMKTTLSFQVTFVMPEGKNIPAMRDYIKLCLYQGDLQLDPAEVKVHLTNKEVSYGQR